MDADLKRQIDRYTEMISRGGRAHLYAKLADAYRKAGLLQDAAHTARTGLKTFPDSLVVKESLGLCLLDMGEPEEAVRALAPVVERLPENAVAAIALAVSLARIDRTEDAIQVLKRRLTKDPFDKKAGAFLRKLEDKTKSKPKADEADKMPDLPISTGPTPPEMAFVMTSTSALADTLPPQETDQTVDLENIFDETPKPPGMKKDSTGVIEDEEAFRAILERDDEPPLAREGKFPPKERPKKETAPGKDSEKKGPGFFRRIINKFRRRNQAPELKTLPKKEPGATLPLEGDQSKKKGSPE